MNLLKLTAAGLDQLQSVLATGLTIQSVILLVAAIYYFRRREDPAERRPGTIVVAIFCILSFLIGIIGFAWENRALANEIGDGWLMYLLPHVSLLLLFSRLIDRAETYQQMRRAHFLWSVTFIHLSCIILMEIFDLIYFSDPNIPHYLVITATILSFTTPLVWCLIRYITHVRNEPQQLALKSTLLYSGILVTTSFVLFIGAASYSNFIFTDETTKMVFDMDYIIHITLYLLGILAATSIVCWGIYNKYANQPVRPQLTVRRRQ